MGKELQEGEKPERLRNQKDWFGCDITVVVSIVNIVVVMSNLRQGREEEETFHMDEL